MAALYSFNADRFLVRGWDGQGGVVYDEAESTLYELSASAFDLLSTLARGVSATAIELAQDLMGEVPEELDVSLVEGVLRPLVTIGVVRCQAS